MTRKKIANSTASQFEVFTALTPCNMVGDYKQYPKCLLLLLKGKIYPVTCHEGTEGSRGTAVPFL